MTRLIACVSSLLAFLVVGCGGGDITYTSRAGDEGDAPQFEMTGAELTVSRVSSEVWGDTVLITCMTRAGAYTEDGYFAYDDVGNVASAEEEWASGEQSLTVTFGDPLSAPPALCHMEGSDGDIGAAAFCDTGDDTEIPGGRANEFGELSDSPDGKVALTVDETCAEGDA